MKNKLKQLAALGASAVTSASALGGLSQMSVTVTTSGEWI